MLAEHDGFTDEELAFVMSAPAKDDITYRMGRDGLTGGDAGGGEQKRCPHPR